MLDTADELLDSEGLVEAEHRALRDKLQPMLPVLEDGVEQIRKACPRLEKSSSGKRKRRDD